jgi:hypothetical protein
MSPTAFMTQTAGILPESNCSAVWGMARRDEFSPKNRRHEGPAGTMELQD